MLSVDTQIFIRIPEESEQRILHPGTIMAAGDSYTIDLEDVHDLPLHDEQDVLIYYEKKQEFMQQPARVLAVDLAAVPYPIVNLITIGEPVSAESRQCYRVSTALANLAIKVDDRQCPLLDVSATGFAIKTDRSYRVGEQVDAELTHDSQTWTGRACVQSIKELPTGETRYGFHCTDAKNGGKLIDGLLRLSNTVQRQHLRRLAGTA